MTTAAHCNFPDCHEEVASSIEGEALCRSHFISVCYSRLEQYEEMRVGRGLDIADAETMREFIQECSQQADAIENTTKDLDNLERAKLLHIVLSANELGRHLRRSPRKEATIAVRICCDRLGGAWEEDTDAVLLSRHGAAVRCRHPVKLGESLQIIRSDTGQKANARVAWQRPSGNDGMRMGIEFVDYNKFDNFWGVDWALAEDIE
jgi:hypothetical protein